MVSPRRSGRTTSTPADRNSRWHHKSPSPSSLSDDNLDAQSAAPASPDDSRQTRRATRAQNTSTEAADDQSQPIDADDEVTRCVCGLQDYPGPPSTEDFPTIADPSQAEDAGGLFIQCDKCHVWQHGGCVGIMDETKSPENYFCELCEKKLHNVLTDPKGQRYSRYLPVFKPEPKSARKPSLTKESESTKARKERDGQNRASVESSSGKRRSTMNSRQAYDDEETLRRIIEETKGSADSTPAVRKNKRGRDDSEDSKHEIKRQRTGSDSPNPPSTLHTASLAAESDDDNPHAKSNKKARSAAVEAIRQKEVRERDRARDQKRAEAAGRRSERAGRRRADESEALEETPNPIATPLLPASQPPSPPASAPPQPPASSHKKGTAKKQKRLGRNQYSAPRASSPHRSKSQPTLTQTNPSSGDDPTNSTTESKNSPSSANDTSAVPTAIPTKQKPGKWGRGKNQRQPEAENGAKDKEKSQITITDMKKRTALMMDYISKAQIDLAGDRTPLGSAALSQHLPQPQPQSADFKELSSREMMDVLTRHIMAWQNEYAEPPASVA